MVEIAPNGSPPVCRLMDYGKFRYNQQKKRNEARNKQKQIQVKEIKFRPGTDEGDYQIKLRNLVRFLGDGDKVWQTEIAMVMSAVVAAQTTAARSTTYVPP